MAKNRVNIPVYPYDYVAAHVTMYDTFREVVAPELRKRGMIAEVSGHGYDSWLPPDRYPQFYEAGHNVFDVTNGAAVQQYIANVLAYLKARPEVRIFDAWPTRPRDVASERHRRLWLRRERRSVRRAAAHDGGHRRAPGVRIEEVAYDHTATQNALYDDLIKKWRQAFGGDIGIYEYYRKYSWHWLPCDLIGLIGLEVPYYRSIGASGLGTYSEPADWIAYEALYAEAAALSWNTELDVAAWRQGVPRRALR